MKRKSERSHHNESHHQFGAGRDSQGERTGDGIVKEGLQQISGQGKRSAQNTRGQCTGGPDLRYNIPGYRVGAVFSENVRKLCERNCYAADTEIQRQKKKCQENQDDKGCIVSFVFQHVMSLQLINIGKIVVASVQHIVNISDDRTEFHR